MNYWAIISCACCLTLAACKKQVPEQQSIQCIAAKVSIGDKQIDSVIQWNVMTGEARLLNAAFISDNSTGKKGSLIGWVPLVDLQQALRNFPTGVNPAAATKKPEQDLPMPRPSYQPIAPGKKKTNFPIIEHG